ncbi:ATP synthase F0 subunit B [Mycoplasma sp. Mirounga ES2805-ORL]|uniref:F0F1 ATP synthase subunit B family protein n=1 Tax=Mycoplasma sp. Mirounga ES2805-ORL TaxID=754514 RepID=UPI00197B49A3|nr:ATP synthase F0 subunit B [Mycoplasma sp. Mirounga ES2805-ORL]QSF13832.1 ATP synthase F0 subunit B [Mycoplasma sp. Mirounga ES2805-ORL]
MRQDLAEKFEKIFPSIWMMLATLIALAITVLILTFLLYKPVKKSIKDRQDLIQKEIDHSIELNKKSDEKLYLANLKLDMAGSEANNIVKNAKVEAEKVIIDYTNKAKTESKRMIDEAKILINKEHQALLEDQRNQIAKAATELSRKILAREVSKKTESELIDEFLKD